MTPTLDILASSSAGNAYVVTAGGQRLMIECGVQMNKILPALDFDVTSVVGCISTHRHFDHMGYYKQVMDYNIPVYSNKEVAGEFEGVFPLLPKHKYNIGSFQVMGLYVNHGLADCYTYIIDHPSTGRIVFATDCEDFPYDIPDVTTLMIEANYSEEILLNKALDGEEIRSRSETHMEINRAISVIERMYSPKLRRVVLLHLSDGFSDERAFIQAVREKVGDIVEVYAADKGMRVGLDKDWF